MRRHMLVLLLWVFAPSLAMPQSAPEMPYELVTHFLKLPPHLHLGEAAGVAVNSKGHIFVYSNSGHTQLLEFEPTGNFIRLIGEDIYGFTFGHSVQVDRHDNIWTVDEGSNEVIKFTPDGEVDMVLGRKAAPTLTTQPGAPAKSSLSAELPPSYRAHFDRLFYRPTDIAFGLDDAVFVSDGYGNSRIVKFAKDGSFVKAWGQKGTGPGEFRTPHSIATDAKGNVYVADVGNKRIQIFDSDGNYLKEWSEIPPHALCITPAPKQFVFVLGADMESRPIYKLDMDGKVLGVISGYRQKLGHPTELHSLACPSDSLLFSGDVQNWKVEKFILHESR